MYTCLVVNILSTIKTLLLALCSVSVAICLSHYVKCDVIMCMYY
jgi:hypothetical protein